MPKLIVNKSVCNAAASCYVRRHLRRVWAPLLFEGEERQEERKRRDPILPTQPPASAWAMKGSRETADEFPVYSFQTLVSEVASRARVTYALQRDDSDLTFRQVSEPTPLQERAYELI
ncbi:MAG: hypothetical protein M1404_05475 [Acidobacteria bacterium]|nr:hypothetical protein [Acidobacteriota bacterium]